MPDLRASALSCLREGRVTLVRVAFTGAWVIGAAADTVLAIVESSRGPDKRYVVDFPVEGAWVCTCGKPVCAHAAAVMLVTGHPSPAAKNIPAGSGAPDASTPQGINGRAAS